VRQGPPSLVVEDALAVVEAGLALAVTIESGLLNAQRRLYAQLGIADRTEIVFLQGGPGINGEYTFDFLHNDLKWPRPTNEPILATHNTCDRPWIDPYYTRIGPMSHPANGAIDNLSQGVYLCLYR
jgi:hypothetical protein